MKYRNPRSLPSVPPPDYRERLHRLADFVDGISPDDFTLDDWISRDGRRGCALGLAATHCEALKAHGLRLGQDDLPVYIGTGGLDAITGFFGFTRRDAKRVFGAQRLSRLSKPAANGGGAAGVGEATTVRAGDGRDAGRMRRCLGAGVAIRSPYRFF